MHSSRSALRCTCFLSMACLALPTVMTRASATSGCEGLLRLRLVNARITSATNVAAGEFPAPAGTSAATSKFYATLPSFCHVTATLTPSNDSNITMEVWLPQKNWNGRLEAVGNGGWAGAIPLSSLASVLLSGFAAAGTDSGHIGNNAEFALGHPEKLIDFGYRSIHETAIQSKVIINAYYRTPARFAYFNGCSQGGRQGLSEAQRYPQDFNGIIAGASAINQMSMHAARTALNLEVNKDKESVIPKAK